MEKMLKCEFDKVAGPTCPSVAMWKATQQLAAIDQTIEDLTKEKVRVTTFKNEIHQEAFKRFCQEKPLYESCKVTVTDFGN